MLFNNGCHFEAIFMGCYSSQVLFGFGKDCGFQLINSKWFFIGIFFAPILLQYFVEHHLWTSPIFGKMYRIFILYKRRSEFDSFRSKHDIKVFCQTFHHVKVDKKIPPPKDIKLPIYITTQKNLKVQKCNHKCYYNDHEKKMLGIYIKPLRKRRLLTQLDSFIIPILSF